MKIGLGGGIGPIRGGISNKGVGGGVGPLSGGTNFSGGGCGAILALVILVALAFWLVAWPWYLGSWIAVEVFGAGDPSGFRTFTGWLFEFGAVAVGVWLVILYLGRSRGSAATQDTMGDTRLKFDASATEGSMRTAEVVPRTAAVDPPFALGQGRDITTYSNDELRALARFVRSLHGALPEEEGLRRMQHYLGYSRMGPRIRERLTAAWRLP